MKRIILIPLLFLTACTLLYPFYPETSFAPTPPGWGLLVSQLFMDDNAMPDGWKREADRPKGSFTDVAINHVYRGWRNAKEHTGGIEQSIWRSYVDSDAKKRFASQLLNQYGPPSTPGPSTKYVPFVTPKELTFQSKVADQFYVACGWYDYPKCIALARYRNYVTEVIASWKTDGEGGMTLEEVNAVLKNMDAKFAAFLRENPLPEPTPSQ
jgi:hypothetical protein